MLKGKTALVTGSTSGIGLGLALSLARQGANVMLNGFGDVAGAKAEVAKLGGKVSYHGADMSKPAEIEAMVRACEAEFGAVDILVNNAGIQHVANVEDFPADRWDAIIAINLSSAFHTTRAALPGMKARNWGRVINVASAHGLVASAQKSAYVAAKHGLVGFTKSVALEGAPRGIRCSRHWCKSRWTPAPQRWACRTRTPSGACWPKSSPRCSSPRPSSWANWPSSCAHLPPTTCAAWPGPSMAAGQLNKHARRRQADALELAIPGQRRRPLVG